MVRNYLTDPYDWLAGVKCLICLMVLQTRHVSYLWWFFIWRWSMYWYDLTWSVCYSDLLAAYIMKPLQFFFFFQAEDGIRDIGVTGVQTCALPILIILFFTIPLIYFLASVGKRKEPNKN